jgi:hypothetical protein
MFVNVFCREDQWPYSAYPLNAYQQQQGRVCYEYTNSEAMYANGEELYAEQQAFEDHGAEDSQYVCQYAPRRREVANGGLDSIVPESSMQQNGDRFQVAMGGAGVVFLDTSRTRGEGDASVLTNGAAVAAVTPQPLASHPLLVTCAGDVYVGDNVPKQRSAEQSQATSDKLQEDFLNPGKLSVLFVRSDGR